MKKPPAEEPLVPFVLPAVIGTEQAYVQEVFARSRFSGNREFSRRCNAWLTDRFGSPGAFVTSSGTHALEMAALLSDIRPGDEVITASFGFSSTANAFALRGARIVFVDVRPDTMNLDETLIEAAINQRTRAIVVMHYGGVACEMDAILETARRHGLVVIEDAAHAILSRYRGRLCGTFGRFACFSFHESKNVHCGEGGALLTNEARDIERAEIIQEKGTDRSKLFRGEVDKYTWVSLGSSYLPSELNTSFLLAQLEAADSINEDRIGTWNSYFERLTPLAREGIVGLPAIPSSCTHNAHCFFVKAAGVEERDSLMDFMNSRGVRSVFHYIPLHRSAAGQQYGRFHGEDRWTTAESERLLRLPLYYRMPSEFVDRAITAVFAFYGRSAD